jgi:N-acetyl-1-D-myo-inositol-2-amino-2-deoxy-alpha-D-glucopyranoside deacetylase
MLVHAHPDDESIGTGLTMSRYAAEGAAVTLVTCTMGEEGEVLVPELAHLAADREDALGPHRMTELDEAMSILGCTDYVRLGGDYRYRDSGMAWAEESRVAATVPSEVRPGTFWTADLLTAANDLVPVIRDRRPQILITYDEWGLYGHPDHIQAHRVAMYAYQLAGIRSYRRDLGEPWLVDRVLWTAFSESMMRESIKTMRAQGNTTYFEGIDPEGAMPPMARPDSDIDACLTDERHARAKIAALRAYRTQIAAEGEFFAGGEEQTLRFWGIECYRHAAGVPFPECDGWVDDLFAGLG